MKKILLIEDRDKRQQLFMESTGIALDDYTDVLDNCIFDMYEDVELQLIRESFDFSQYDYIISHKSAYDKENSKVISTLQNYCKKTQKPLIFFSGGISVNYYDNSEFEFLELNSKTFYSQNLKIFLDATRNGDENILMLCYGKQWMENVVANVLEKTNLFIFDVQNYQTSPSEFKSNQDLSKIEYKFYEIKDMNLSEIIKFKQSLEEYFSFYTARNTKNRSVVIHHDNVCDLELFENHIKFIFSGNDVDSYICGIMDELREKDFEMIFIKDNLTSNYMELLGVRVAYHIRLSKELGDKRFVPIVVISDFDAEQLNRFDALSAILFTKNISLIKNTKEEIGKFQSIYIQNLTQEEYGSEFLSKIKVEAPKDYLSHHDISNEWAIYRWGEFLKVDGKAIDKNKQKIESMLYFKYLKSKYSFQDREDFKINRPSKGGKVLLIDDEWKKGWSDILHTALSSQDLELKTFEYNYKDKSEFNLIVQLNYKELKEQIQNTDVVILDLRLTENDHNNGDIDNYTGVKILQRIHEINAGIQVIMLTATSKSTVLEKLYEYKILGYIKKEHPEDHSISTVENINKLIYLVDKGLNRKFLKNIYVTKIKILEILEYDIIAQYGIELERYEPFCLKLQVEIESIFDILDGNSQNRFLYAMVSIASSLEAILSIFINDREMTFWDKEPYNCEHNALWCRIDKLFNKIGSIKQFNTRELIQKRNSYLHRKPVTVNEKEITSWFEMLNKMIEIIQNPKN